MLKKISLCFMIVLFIVCVGAVNDAYMDMTERQGGIFPSLRRVDSDYISVSALDRTGYIDTGRVLSGVQNIREEAARVAQNVVVILGIGPQERQDEKEPAREASGTEIL